MKPGFVVFDQASFAKACTKLGLPVPPPPTMPAIYLGGRIERDRVRFGVVECAVYDFEQMQGPAPVVTVTVEHPDDGSGFTFTYTGPWTVGDDHGTAHIGRPPKGFGTITARGRVMPLGPGMARGTRSHGAGTGPGVETDDDWTARDVHRRAMEGLRNATHAFFWLADEQCFGTLVEIGHAAALGKTVIVAHAPDVAPDGELWFAFESADFVVGGFDDAHDAFWAAVDGDLFDIVKAVPVERRA